MDSNLKFWYENKRNGSQFVVVENRIIGVSGTTTVVGLDEEDRGWDVWKHTHPSAINLYPKAYHCS